MTTTHDPDATIARFIPDPAAPDQPIDVVSLVAAGGHLAGDIGSTGLIRVILSALEHGSPPEVVDGLLAFASVAARLEEADDASV